MGSPQTGTIDNCPRHGRRPATATRKFSPTKDMVEQSRSGAYIPVGMIRPSQLEATSPWIFEERAKRLHAEDVCPDCAAEQGYKRRESVKASDRVLEAAARFHGADIPVSSPTPVKAPPSDAKQPTVTGPVNDYGRFVVVQHEGILDRLAYDTRRGPLTRESTERLSENLVKVSRAVAQLGSVDEHPPPQDQQNAQPETGGPEPKPQRSSKAKSCSMAELLEDLHAIAAEMNLDISDTTRAIERSGDSHDTPRPTPGQLSEAATPRPPAATVSVPEHRPAPINDATPSPPSTYFTASSTRDNSVQATPTELPSTILRAADYFPSTNPTPTPTALRTVSRVINPPLARKKSFHASNHSPTSPSSPWSVQSPKPIKRVRVSDRWPPQQYRQQQQQVLPLSIVNRTGVEQPPGATEAHRVLREAAEAERRLRRARTHGELGGAGRG